MPPMLLLKYSAPAQLSLGLCFEAAKDCSLKACSGPCPLPCPPHLHLPPLEVHRRQAELVLQTATHLPVPLHQLRLVA